MNRNLSFNILVCLAYTFLIGVSISAGDPGTDTVPRYGEPPSETLGKIAQQQSIPASRLWGLKIENNFRLMKGDVSPSHRGSNILKIKPVFSLPAGSFLGDRVSALFRPVIPLVSMPFLKVIPPAGPLALPRLEWDRENGLGDIGLLLLLGHVSRTKGFAYGIGPTWIFPAASEDVLGQGKWQAGPAGALAYLGEKWVFGLLVQQWWSFAGQDDRPDTSAMDILYSIHYRVTPTWLIGMDPTIGIDWKGGDDNKLSLPIGLGSSVTVKIGKFPVVLGFEVQYYLRRPDNFGPEWNFRVFMFPVFRRPFAGK